MPGFLREEMGSKQKLAAERKAAAEARAYELHRRKAEELRKKLEEAEERVKKQEWALKVREERQRQRQQRRLEKEAAVRIQSRFRGALSRRNLSIQYWRKAAVALQAVFRGRAAIAQVADLKMKRQEAFMASSRNLGALSMQRMWRGFQGRQEGLKKLADRQKHLREAVVCISEFWIRVKVWRAAWAKLEERRVEYRMRQEELSKAALVIFAFGMRVLEHRRLVKEREKRLREEQQQLFWKRKQEFAKVVEEREKRVAERMKEISSSKRKHYDRAETMAREVHERRHFVEEVTFKRQRDKEMQRIERTRVKSEKYYSELAKEQIMREQRRDKARDKWTRLLIGLKFAPAMDIDGQAAYEEQMRKRSQKREEERKHAEAERAEAERKKQQAAEREAKRMEKIRKAAVAREARKAEEAKRLAQEEAEQAELKRKQLLALQEKRAKEEEQRRKRAKEALQRKKREEEKRKKEEEELRARKEDERQAKLAAKRAETQKRLKREAAQRREQQRQEAERLAREEEMRPFLEAKKREEREAARKAADERARQKREALEAKRRAEAEELERKERERKETLRRQQEASRVEVKKLKKKKSRMSKASSSQRDVGRSEEVPSVMSSGFVSQALISELSLTPRDDSRAMSPIVATAERPSVKVSSKPVASPKRSMGSASRALAAGMAALAKAEEAQQMAAAHRRVGPAGLDSRVGGESASGVFLFVDDATGGTAGGDSDYTSTKRAKQAEAPRAPRGSATSGRISGGRRVRTSKGSKGSSNGEELRRSGMVMSDHGPVGEGSGPPTYRSAPNIPVKRTDSRGGRRVRPNSSVPSPSPKVHGDDPEAAQAAHMALRSYFHASDGFPPPSPGGSRHSRLVLKTPGAGFGSAQSSPRGSSGGSPKPTTPRGGKLKSPRRTIGSGSLLDVYRDAFSDAYKSRPIQPSPPRRISSKKSMRVAKHEPDMELLDRAYSRIQGDGAAAVPLWGAVGKPSPSTDSLGPTITGAAVHAPAHVAAQSGGIGAAQPRGAPPVHAYMGLGGGASRYTTSMRVDYGGTGGSRPPGSPVADRRVPQSDALDLFGNDDVIAPPPRPGPKKSFKRKKSKRKMKRKGTKNSESFHQSAAPAEDHDAALLPADTCSGGSGKARKTPGSPINPTSVSPLQNRSVRPATKEETPSRAPRSPTKSTRSPGRTAVPSLTVTEPPTAATPSRRTVSSPGTGSTTADANSGAAAAAPTGLLLSAYQVGGESDGYSDDGWDTAPDTTRTNRSKP